MIRAIFFDLFFTLIVPNYSEQTEYDVVGMSALEWENYAEEAPLYVERALGRVKTDKEIIDRIVDRLPGVVTEEQREMIRIRREARMKNALMNVDAMVLGVLQELHNSNIKLCIISNADVIDIKHWQESPLARYFDSAIFSCQVGLMKPDIAIYHKAMKELDVLPEESVFIGDGGSKELFGAKKAGMQTIFTEYLHTKTNSARALILPYADKTIRQFDEILKYIDQTSW